LLSAACETCFRQPARLAFGSLLVISAASCKKASEHQPHHYQRIVIVGNSITRHPPKADIGWQGDWGMAATARDSDFVHILKRRFEQEKPGAVVKFQNIAEWERTYYKYDLARLDTIKQFQPDLVIVRIGENIAGDSIAIHHFDLQFPRLLDCLRGNSTRLVVASSFWSGNPARDAMKRMASAHDAEFVSLDELEKDPANSATGQFQNTGVAKHPSNKGMRAIANTIWDNL
jgi:hypothetical protein